MAKANDGDAEALGVDVVLARLVAALGASGGAIDLGISAAALTVGVTEGPMGPAHMVGALDRLAAEVGRDIPAQADPVTRLASLVYRLFGTGRLHGRGAAKATDRHCDIGWVLTTGEGLPITLAIIGIEVAQRLGIDLFGIGFPGHFLLGCADPEVTIDPVDGGKIMDELSCRTLLERATRGGVEWRPSLLEPSPQRAILTRVLHNLKAIYVMGHQVKSALSVIECLVWVAPEARVEVRDRGLLRMITQDYQGAVADLTVALIGVGAESAERTHLEAHLERARQGIWRMN